MERLGEAKRNYGIDLLRIVSMFYVVVLHVLGQGGILDTAAKGSVQYQTAWFMEMWSLCAVNIFGLISGYVGYTEKEKPHSYAGYLVTWLQVVFYGVVVSCFFAVWKPELVESRHVLKMFFPVSTDLHWYFTAYTALFLVMPVLNTAVRHCSRTFLQMLFLSMFLVFSLFDTFTNRMNLVNGYSFVWLVILYLLGAIMKKCSIGKDVSVFAALGGIALCVFFSWLWKMQDIEFDFYIISATKHRVESYPFPCHVLAAMLHLIVFSKLRFGKIMQKTIAFMAPGAFAVYILNTQKFIWSEVMSYRFHWLASESTGYMVENIMKFSIGFVLFALLADWLRRKIFDLLHVKQGADYVAAFVKKGLHKLTVLLFCEETEKEASGA